MTNTTKPIFSLPFSPYMKNKEYEDIYLPFVQKYHSFIYDIYVTVHIPPFTSDAMGGGSLKSDELIQKALRVQNDTKKPISATFNNIHIPPTKENLALFIDSFAPLYEAGIHFITLPFTHWMLSGELFATFPLLRIKNSVLNRIDNAQSYWDSALAGYSVVNLDRKLLRDKKTLEEIKKAQNLFASTYGFAPLTQILANENCIGLCPVMDEHFSINIATGSYGVDYTCKKWKTLDDAYSYRVANLSPFKEDIDEILKCVDMLKLHGRGGTALLQDSMEFVSDFVKEKELFEYGKKLFKNPTSKATKKWRQTIKTCRFQCWDCEVCDGVD